MRTCSDTIQKHFMNILQQLTQKIISFREERDWKKFHNPKDVALSLVLESTELLEHFQWKNGEELEKYLKEHKAEIADELADVMNWVLLLSHDLDIDIAKAVEMKIQKNADKYPIEKSKGIATKYRKL